MINEGRPICICIFEQGDQATPGERIRRATETYCRLCGREPVAEEKLQVERTKEGKPYFPYCREIHFSISHSGDYWACAVAGEPVGLDLQEHTRFKGESKEEAAGRFRKMAHRFFHPLEAEFVELSCYNNFFTVWTAREAYVKYTGQGIDKHFSEHCVVPEEKECWQHISGRRKTADCSEVIFAGTERGSGASWTAMGKLFCCLDYPEDYTICVCVEHEMTKNILLQTFIY